MSKIAFIGLGTMGFPMAGHLKARGAHDVVVYNRTRAKADAWAAKFGGRSAATPAEAADGADFVFTCVGNDDDLRAVTLGRDGAFQALGPSAVFIDHTTASAQIARELYERAQERRARALDAPVSGGQSGAENGTLTVMVGGDEASFAAAKPVIEAYARTVNLIGPAGSGQLTKMVNQICIGGLIEALAEALHFAARAGLDIEKVIGTISKGAAQSWQMDNRWQTMVEGKFDFGFAVEWVRKDFAMIFAEARRNGASLPVTALVDEFYGEIQAMGGRRWDTSSLIARLERKTEAEMTARIIDGKSIAAELSEKIAEAAKRLIAEHGIEPGLAVVLVGDNPASEIYVRSKTAKTAATNMRSYFSKLPATATESELLELVERMNQDPTVHGILVQLPLPPQIDSRKVIEAIAPAKDVDGFHPLTAGLLSTGLPGIVPCTPLACIMLAKKVHGSLAGMEAVVIGRSNIVGKPLAQLLLMENATVTIAHSKTRDLPSVSRRGDLVFAAVGQPEMVRRDWIKPGATVIDVGINRVPAGDGKSKIVGDVAFEEVEQIAGAITPVPGGVGPMTIACLMLNTLKAACAQNGLPPPSP